MANPNSPIFPSSVVTDSSLPITNDAFVTSLVNNITSTQTNNIQLVSASFNYPCILDIESESILVTAVSGNTVSGCVRGYIGTTAAAHNGSPTTVVINLIYATLSNQQSAEIKAIETYLLTPRKYSTPITVGSGAGTQTITHNLNSTDLTFQFYYSSGSNWLGTYDFNTFEIVDANNVSFSFTDAFTGKLVLKA